MSAKWRRNLAWDDEFFPPWAFGFKVLLRLFSSIPLAVVLLSLVVVFATLASVPIGLLARLPTYLVIFASLVASSILPGAVVGWLVRRSGAGTPRLAIVGGVLATLIGGTLWFLFALPGLGYDWGTGEGFMLFAGFCQRYSGTTLRRLPALEMTEPEFYAWWPLRLVLLLFVTNMVVATLRRIEFRFVNIGVLCVHSGIVLLTLGSLYYGSLKREGDALLFAGVPLSTGEMTPGPWEDVFYDAMKTALHVRLPGRNWAQLPLKGVPRYNDYNVEASVGRTLNEGVQHELEAYDDGDRELSIVAPDLPGESNLSDLHFRVVGYASYAEETPAEDWIKVDLADLRSIPADFRANPIRIVELTVPVSDELGQQELRKTPLFFMPRDPARAQLDLQDITVEYTIGRSAERTRDLLEPIPGGVSGDGAGVTHALLIEVPGSGHREVYPLDAEFAGEDFDVFDAANAQAVQTIEVGDTGYEVELLALLEEPPLKIVTPGYEGATSSMAMVRVRRVDGDKSQDPAAGGGPYVRWVYSRFPEISQDFVGERTGDGRPVRRDADPAIRISYIDLSQIRFYLNENDAGELGLIVRAPDGQIDRIERIGSHEGHANLLRVVESWEHGERFERPIPVPRYLQESDKVGTHERARIAVEVTSDSDGDWKRIVWVPFSLYLDRSAHQAPPASGTGVIEGLERWVRTPDGRMVEIVFGRAWRRFPGFEMRLLDFQMIEYAYRGAPKDYQSTVEVAPHLAGAFEQFTHTARLNAPLRAPFNIYDTSIGIVARVLGRIRSGLDPAQFKLSQSGWDPNTWERTRAMVDSGELERPYVTHTILHVGNNPGIHIIALGGILMALGVPWAFYIKPWLLRRKKRMIQRQLRNRGGKIQHAPATRDEHDEPDLKKGVVV